ncbi:serine threonine- kinase CDL1-like [Olea europaea subsp. europaea]|uniref:Serine threonine- kinase CDL1-like n=1 Tax=Olea europaea subsp. europaea TaxID=158383 RepID=A0A8S0RNA6_OLEEU|nr:serine threonine- kinase CDL1-like [Olea europaea subsp. europaea]
MEGNSSDTGVKQVLKNESFKEGLTTQAHGNRVNSDKSKPHSSNDSQKETMIPKLPTENTAAQTFTVREVVPTTKNFRPECLVGEERVRTLEETTSEDETSDEAHEGSGTSGEEEESGANDSEEAEGEDSKDHDSGDSDGDRVRRSGQTGTFSTPYVHRATSPMHAPSTFYARPTAIVGSSLTIDDVQGMLLDQRILIEMWLRTVKLEIMQHMSDEIKKLKDFISIVVPTSCSKCTARAVDVDLEPRQLDYGGFADYAGHHSSPDGPDKDMVIDRQEGDDMCITKEHKEPCSERKSARHVCYL